MLFGAVLWYCSLVPFQTFSQQEAYEALSRYNNLFFLIILINTNVNIIINIFSIICHNSAVIIIAIIIVINI